MSVLDASPVNEDCNIKCHLSDESVTLEYMYSGIKFSKSIEQIWIDKSEYPEQFKGFDIKTLFLLINDILSGKGTYKIECNSEECIVSMYLKIEGYCYD